MQFNMTVQHGVAITPTSKGHRVWIQGLQGKGITGPFVIPVFTAEAITLQFVSSKVQGARKVTQAKGGIVDLQSKKVTRWAQGADSVRVAVKPDTQTIVITREGE